MSYKSIKGQDSAVAFLQISIARGTVAHAYIFHGPQGAGKFSTAVQFAKALNCHAPQDGAPCDVCPSCVKIEKVSHPDLIVARQGNETSIGIDDIRDVIHAVGLKPFEARYKVCIIDGAGLLTQQASNALLKTLEEPPPFSVIILIAEKAHGLYRTIVSRAQVVRFDALTAEVIRSILTEKYGISPEKAKILARFSSGGIDASRADAPEKFLDMREGLTRALALGTFLESDYDAMPKEESRVVLDMMLTWYRDIIMEKAALGPEALMHEDKREALAREAAGTSWDRLYGITEKIIEMRDILKGNVNTKLAMHMMGFETLAQER